MRKYLSCLLRDHIATAQATTSMTEEAEAETKTEAKPEPEHWFACLVAGQLASLNKQLRVLVAKTFLGFGASHLGN